MSVYEQAAYIRIVADSKFQAREACVQLVEELSMSPEFTIGVEARLPELVEDDS